MDNSKILSLLMFLTFVFSLYSNRKLNLLYQEYKGYRSSSSMSGAKIAEVILISYKFQNVGVMPVSMSLYSRFSIARNKVLLKEDTYFENNLASIVASAYATGQAVQFNLKSKGFLMSKMMLPFAKLAKSIVYPIFALGLVFNLNRFGGYANLLWIFLLIFQTIYIPVEIESNRLSLDALTRLEIISNGEVVLAHKYMRTVKFTYLASYLFSVFYLLRGVV